MHSLPISARIALCLIVAASVYAGGGPRLQGITPGGGSTSGGEEFRLRGSGFDSLPSGTLGILFGDAPATGVSKTSDREIRGTTPAHPEGFVDVVISIGGAAYPDAGSDRYRFTADGGGGGDCASAADCDDLDPCTVDACAGTCQHTAVTSAEALTAGAPACVGLTMPKKIGKKFLAGCTKLGQRTTAPNDRKRAKLRTQAAKSFGKAAKTAGKAKALAGDCATQLGALLQAARSFAEAQP